jgi:Tol biopolymer transport system component/DNA-binding winged helix-turn-helix (wHTH) protein
VIQEIHRFGPFELDIGRSELRRRGRRLRLSASLTRLLKLLVTHPSQLVTREQIAACLWDQPQYVDITSGINTAVNRLRAVLDDNPAQSVYIETVVGLGYRFIARVECNRETLENPPPETAPVAASNGSEPAGTFEALHLTAEGQASAAPVMPSVTEQNRVEAASNRPATETGGPETAYLASAAKAGRAFPGWMVILVSLLLGVAAATAWKYHRQTLAGDSSDQFPSRNDPFAQQTYHDGAHRIVSAAISHNAKMAAIVDGRGISIRVLDRQVERLIYTPPNLLVSRVSWSPSDSDLMVSGKQKGSGQDQIWKASLGSERPILLLQNASEAVWSPDGNQIAFIRPQGAELWLADANGGSEHRLSEGSGQDRISSLLWTPDGKRLVYDRRVPPTDSGHPVDSVPDESAYRWQYECVNAVTGKLLAKEVNFQFDSAYILSDGRMYFPKGNPLDASYDAQLYMVKTDPASGQFESEPRPVHPLAGYNALSLSASNLGQDVAVLLDRPAETVFVADLQLPGPSLGTVYALSQPAPSNYPHAWTPTGDAVIFESNQLGDFAIFRQKPDGSAPELLTRSYEDAVLPQITPDGQWILFENVAGSHETEISRVSIHGGEPEQVPTQGVAGEFQCSVSPQGACVVRQVTSKYLIYFALDAISGIGKELGRIPWVEHSVGDWSLSPDGTTVALPVQSQNRPAIRLVTLGSGAQSRTRDIEVHGEGTLQETTWAADSKGFYVEAKTPAVSGLLYVDLSGKSKILRETKAPIWGVPSRDGKRIAFGDTSVNRNLWIAHQFVSPTK